MNNIRHLDKTLSSHFKKYKEIMILLGARQVGKTTILKKIFPKGHYLTVDNEPIRRNLDRYDVSVYKQILPQNNKTIIIDEIHLLKDPGKAAKIIFDQIENIKLIITGSSSLRIKNKSSESLAGRKIDYYLYPLTFSEYIAQKGIENKLNFNILENIINGKKLVEKKAYPFDISAILDNMLLYGQYPAIINHPNDELYLKNLVDSVVFKDLLDLNLIENKQTALNLLRLLAYQIGSLVNISELSNRLSTDVKTIKKYISVFEQSFIIFSIYPYLKRGRDEIGKMPKIYFYDTGLRNAIIDNFQPLSARIDAGALFENFIISEIKKQNYYSNNEFSLHFWRTKQGSEIDLILEKNNTLYAVEIKKGGKKINMAFKKRYPHAKLKVITKSNFY